MRQFGNREEKMKVQSNLSAQATAISLFGSKDYPTYLIVGKQKADNLDVYDVVTFSNEGVKVEKQYEGRVVSLTAGGYVLNATVDMEDHTLDIDISDARLTYDKEQQNVQRTYILTALTNKGNRVGYLTLTVTMVLNPQAGLYVCNGVVVNKLKREQMLELHKSMQANNTAKNCLNFSVRSRPVRDGAVEEIYALKGNLKDAELVREEAPKAPRGVSEDLILEQEYEQKQQSKVHLLYYMNRVGKLANTYTQTGAFISPKVAQTFAKSGVDGGKQKYMENEIAFIGRVLTELLPTLPDIITPPTVKKHYKSLGETLIKKAYPLTREVQLKRLDTIAKNKLHQVVDMVLLNLILHEEILEGTTKRFSTALLKEITSLLGTDRQTRMHMRLAIDDNLDIKESAKPYVKEMLKLHITEGAGFASIDYKALQKLGRNYDLQLALQFRVRDYYAYFNDLTIESKRVDTGKDNQNDVPAVQGLVETHPVINVLRRLTVPQDYLTPEERNQATKEKQRVKRASKKFQEMVKLPSKLEMYGIKKLGDLTHDFETLNHAFGFATQPSEEGLKEMTLMYGETALRPLIDPRVSQTLYNKIIRDMEEGYIELNSMAFASMLHYILGRNYKHKKTYSDWERREIKVAGRLMIFLTAHIPLETAEMVYMESPLLQESTTFESVITLARKWKELVAKNEDNIGFVLDYGVLKTFGFKVGVKGAGLNLTTFPKNKARLSLFHDGLGQLTFEFMEEYNEFVTANRTNHPILETINKYGIYS